MRSCKELREATEVRWVGKGLSEADLATLATLGSVLPALDTLALSLHFTPASTAAKDAVREALAKSRQSRRAALSPWASVLFCSCRAYAYRL